MGLHLNWDDKQNNGVIYNNKYTGCLFSGIENRPVLSFEYEYFVYSDVHPVENIKKLRGETLSLTDAEIAEIKTVALAWEQPLGQEGNPTLGQAKAQKLWELRQQLDKMVFAIDNSPNYERMSWSKQESEARAYLVDNTAPTPLIDNMILTRASGETRDDLVGKIIINADAYAIAYGQLLGKYQKLCKDVNNEIDIDSISLIQLV